MNEQIEKIKKAVLEEWFGTKSLEWVKECPNDEISEEDVVGCVEIAIRKTADEIFRELEDYVLCIADMSVIDNLKKKWGVEDVS